MMAISFDDLVKDQSGFEDLIPKTAPPPAQDPGMLANSVRALRMGLPFGNQMVAAEKTLLPESLGGSKGFDYGANLADVNAADARLQQQHPYLADLGEGTTGALAALAIPGAALGEGAGAIPQVVRGAGAGFGIGALQGAGAPGSDIRNVPRTAQNAIIGGYVGGAVGGALPGAVALAGKAISPLAAGLSRAPDIAGLGSDVDAAYSAVRNSGAGYSPEKFKMLTDKIAADAQDENISAKLNPKASAIIEDMQARADAAVKAGKPITLDDLDKERQYVNDNLAGIPEAKQARFGAMIKNNIDEFINKADPQAVTARAPRAPVDYNAPPGPDASYVPPGASQQNPLAAALASAPQAPPRGSGPAPIPLLDVMRNYGLQDEGGDLASMGFANKGGRAPGVDRAFKVIDKDNGVPMDEGLRVAKELGYMEPDDTVSDFINKLGDHPTYSRADAEEVARRQARSEFDLGMSPSGELGNEANYAPPQIKPPQLVAARKIPGDGVQYGAPGQVHADLVMNADDLHGQPGTMEKFNDLNPDDLGFAKPGGPFMSREEAAAHVGANEPLRAGQAQKLGVLDTGGYTGEATVPAIAPDQVPAAPTAADAAGLIRNARDLAQRQFKAKALDTALGKATDRADVAGTGGNIENTTRQKLLAIRDNQNWSPAELAQLNKIIHGTTETNALRFASRFGPKGHALMALGELLAMGSGNPIAMGLGAGGMAAQGGGALARRAAQNRLMATILAGGTAPAAAAAGPGPTRAALAAALATNANLQNPQQQNLSTR